jgi:hypothetical protein
LQKTDAAKPWSDLDLGASAMSRALFNASVEVSVVSGTLVKFWEDPWIGGLGVESIAPEIMKHIWPSIKRARTVADGLPEHMWVRDISGELTFGALRGYLKLWGAIQNVQRRGIDEDDAFRWKWTASGSFTAKSAYLTLFHGTTALAGAANVWNSFAPLKHKMHAWFALRRRCWTADRRCRRWLPSHILCPLCGSREETIPQS